MLIFTPQLWDRDDYAHAGVKGRAPGLADPPLEGLSTA